MSYKVLLEFEAVLAEVQAELGIIPLKAAVAIRSKCDISLVNMQELGAEMARIGYPVLPLVKQLVRLVNDEWAHWGATTQVCSRNRTQCQRCVQN
jgi:3-carboxy-cis,cis-muconate cycloisomerase